MSLSDTVYNALMVTTPYQLARAYLVFRLLTTLKELDIFKRPAGAPSALKGLRACFNLSCITLWIALDTAFAMAAVAIALRHLHA